MELEFNEQDEYLAVLLQCIEEKKDMFDVLGGEKSMTRREREVTDINEILKIMDACKIVHVMGLVDGDQPYVLPMNYGYTYEDGKMVILPSWSKEGL